MIDKEYYEQPNLWSKPPQTYQIQVREDILRLIPTDVKSLLDVGCGGGYITNALPKDMLVVGIDTSMEAIRYVNRLRLINSITHLPFPDKSFDLVQATDVIEHIPEAIYPQALKELQRVARKYILICVPFMEHLNSGLTKCAACGKTYHINHHYRSFGVMELVDLFRDGWVATLFAFTGDTITSRELYFRTLRSLMGVFTEWDMATCPRCNARASTKLVDNQTEYAIAILSHFVPPDYALLHPDRSECLVLFEKGDSIGDSKNNFEMLDLINNSPVKESVIPTIKKYDKRQLLIEVTIEREKPLDYPLWVVWKTMGRVYRYSNPKQFSLNQFLIPSWFSPEHLQKLSPSNAFWTGEKGNELLLIAIKNMVKELNFRRHPKGILHTILERVGLIESKL